MADTRAFDIILYGASGFTGQLVAEYFVKRCPPGSGVAWAMAGRNLDKLAAIRDQIGAPQETPLIVADASDPHSLKAMVEQARVILTTVGPYQHYGSDLVAACAAAGTDYVDLCGEPAWMRKMIDANEAAAKQSGARIVFSCGFDSIPFDLGVLFLQEEAKKAFGASCREVKTRVRQMKGTWSGGTVASFKATMAAALQDRATVDLLKNPFALTPDFQGPTQPSGSKPQFDEALGSWLAPFMMAPINTKNIHRSNFLKGHPYGEDFLYSEMWMTGPGDKGEQFAKAIASDNSIASEDAPKPGEGPSKEEREAGGYDILFIGETAKGESLTAAVKGDMDPGYGSTSKIISEAALYLRNNKETSGGIWTPASAMGSGLIAPLVENAGLTFALE